MANNRQHIKWYVEHVYFAVCFVHVHIGEMAENHWLLIQTSNIGRFIQTKFNMDNKTKLRFYVYLFFRNVSNAYIYNIKGVQLPGSFCV